jgi:hypothetical protein
MPFQELKEVCFICNSRVLEDELVPKLPLTVRQKSPSGLF